MARHDIVERVEELIQDYKNAIADGNEALADQIDVEIDILRGYINLDTSHLYL